MSKVITSDARSGLLLMKLVQGGAVKNMEALSVLIGDLGRSSPEVFDIVYTLADKNTVENVSDLSRVVGALSSASPMVLQLIGGLLKNNGAVIDAASLPTLIATLSVNLEGVMAPLARPSAKVAKVSLLISNQESAAHQPIARVSKAIKSKSWVTHDQESEKLTAPPKRSYRKQKKEGQPSFISQSMTTDATAKGTKPGRNPRSLPVSETGETPAIPIRDSLTPDFIICLEDGKKMKMMKRHLRSEYGMTPDQYRTRWGLPEEYPMVSPNYAKMKSKYAKRTKLGTRQMRDEMAKRRMVTTEG